MSRSGLVSFVVIPQSPTCGAGYLPHVLAGDRPGALGHDDVLWVDPASQPTSVRGRSGAALRVINSPSNSPVSSTSTPMCSRDPSQRDPPFFVLAGHEPQQVVVRQDEPT